MKRFTKSLIALAMLVAGTMGVNAEKKYADLTKLTSIDGANATWNGASNTISWTALSYNCISNFNFEAGDYSTWEKIVVNVASLNNADGIRVQIHCADGSEPVKDFKGTGVISMNISEFGLGEKLKTVSWIRILGCGSQSQDSHNISTDTPGSAVITEVYLERPDAIFITEEELIEAPEGTTDVKLLTGTNADWANTVVYPKEFAVQGQSFGDGNGDKESTHVNIEGYDYISLWVTTAPSNSVALRVWIWNGSSVETLFAHPIADYATADFTTEYRISEPGTYVAKVTGYKYLKGVKAANNWGAPAVVVGMAWMSKGEAPVAYTPSGKTVLVGSEALTDPTATCFNVTGVTSTGITLDAANPNALFIANKGTLANDKNVIVDGVCANLELIDEKPFNAPVAFTATSAKFTKTMKADYGTMVIPFDAELPSDVEAFNITGNNGDVLTTTAAEAIEANKPVMLKGSSNVFTASGAAIAATTEGVQANGLLSGVYTATPVPTENTYVLQNQGEDVNFYKAISGLTVNPFRAYLTTAAATARLTFDFNEATGIKTVKTTEGTEVYNLQGVRVANPTKGLYIVNGKKVIK